MLLSNMLWASYGVLTDLKKLKSALTVKPKFDNLEPIKTYVEGDEYFGIPRNAVEIPNDVEDRRVEGEPVNFEFTGTLRPTQEQYIQKWLQAYEKGYTDTIIKAQTGSGKTILSLYIASLLKVPFLVIVPRDRLMQQWSEQIKSFTTIQDVGIVQQGKCEYEGQTACVGMIHSICKDKYPEEFKKHFGLVIWDELQTTGSTTFSETCKLFPAKYRLGVSATLERQDGCHEVYYKHLGTNVISVEGKTQPDPLVCIHNYGKDSGPLPFWLDRYDPVKTRACILTNIAKNEERNNLIAYFAKMLIDKGKQTLVIGDRIEQLRQIKKALHSYGYTDADLYISKTSDKKKTWLENESRCILATTRMLDIGIDIDTLRGLIFATPQSEVEQIVGRIRRINPAMSKPVVIDIHDGYPETERWAKKRLGYYSREGFQVEQI